METLFKMRSSVAFTALALMATLLSVFSTAVLVAPKRDSSFVVLYSSLRLMISLFDQRETQLQVFGWLKRTRKLVVSMKVSLTCIDISTY